MKYLKYIIISCLTTGMLTSCELDYSPEDWYGSSTFWQNEAQVDGFMVGMHKHLRDINQYIFLMGEAREVLKNWIGVTRSQFELQFSY